MMTGFRMLLWSRARVILEVVSVALAAADAAGV